MSGGFGENEWPWLAPGTSDASAPRMGDAVCMMRWTETGRKRAMDVSVVRGTREAEVHCPSLLRAGTLRACICCAFEVFQRLDEQPYTSRVG